MKRSVVNHSLNRNKSGFRFKENTDVGRRPGRSVAGPGPNGAAVNQRGKDAFIHREVTSVAVLEEPCLCHRGLRGSRRQRDERDPHGTKTLFDWRKAKETAERSHADFHDGLLAQLRRAGQPK